MNDLISREALYEKTCEWEAQALHMCEVTMNDEDKTEWKRWSTILNERSAFKFDIAAAPAIDAVEVVRCKDCYWWDRSWQLIETKPELRNCRKLRTLTREGWFCAEGRRDEQDLP